jgi:hypothetical protein
MAKYKRTIVGSVLKGKDGKPDYIKIEKEMTPGFYNLESKKTQLDNIDRLEEEGRMDKELADQIREKINNIKDFVRFQIVKVERN